METDVCRLTAVKDNIVFGTAFALAIYCLFIVCMLNFKYDMFNMIRDYRIIHVLYPEVDPAIAIRKQRERE
jgi:hypothetical protein